MLAGDLHAFSVLRRSQTSNDEQYWKSFLQHRKWRLWGLLGHTYHIFQSYQKSQPWILGPPYLSR
jgi:hypothetical protein